MKKQRSGFGPGPTQIKLSAKMARGLNFGFKR